MTDERLQFIEEWGKVAPVKWILTEPDGQVSYGRVMDGRIVGGKYDGLPVGEAGKATA